MATTKTTAFFVTKNGDASASPLRVARGAAGAPDTLSGHQHLVALARLMGRQAAFEAIHAGGIACAFTDWNTYHD